MKWTSSLAAAAALFGAAIAGPVKIDERQSHTGIVSYRLRASFEGAPGLDGRYLSIGSGKVGVYNQSLDSSEAIARPLQWYPTEGASKGTWEMHTLPIGIVDNALGLVGKTPLLDFVEIPNPAATTFETGTTAIWSEWGLKNFPPYIILCVPTNTYPDAIPDPPPKVPRDNLVTYVGKGGGGKLGKWVAIPNGQGDWSIYWAADNVPVVGTAMFIDVVWELVPIKC